MAPLLEAYTRKSRALGDADDPELLATHRSLIEQMANQDGISLPPEVIHTEIGSGETIADRPVFAARLAEWEARPPGAGGTIYTPALARLTRGSLAERGRIAEALVRAGIRIRTPGRCWDLRDADDEMLFGILTSVDRAELGRYKQRVSDTRQRQLREGVVRIGRAPWGYVWSKDAKNLLPHPERFPLLVLCCRRVLTTPARSLAREYGIAREALADALRNPIICGWPALRWFPPDPEKPSRSNYVRKPPDEWLWPEKANDTYPHACTLEEWEAIQVVLDHNQRGSKSEAARDDWCRNVVWFPAAPGRVHLSAYWYTRRTPRTRYLTYHATRAGACCFVERALVHEKALDALRALYVDPDYLTAALDALRAREMASAGPGDRQAQVNALALLRRRYQQAVDAEEDAESPTHRAALAERRRRLEREVRQAESELRAAPVSRAVRVPALSPEALRWMGEHFDEAWEKMSDSERRALVNAVIARITVTAQKVPGIRRPVRRVVVELVEWLQDERE